MHHLPAWYLQRPEEGVGSPELHFKKLRAIMLVLIEPVLRMLVLATKQAGDPKPGSLCTKG